MPCHPSLGLAGSQAFNILRFVSTFFLNLIMAQDPMLLAAHFFFCPHCIVVHTAVVPMITLPYSRKHPRPLLLISLN